MQHSITIAINDLRIFFSQRGNLIGLIVLPVALAAVFGLVTFSGETTFTIAVIDLDNTPESDQFAAEIAAANAAFELFDGEVTVESAQTQVTDGEINAALMIPAGFAADLAAFHEVRLTYFSGEDTTAPGPIQQSIAAVVTRWNGAVIVAQTGSRVANNLGLAVEVDTIYSHARDLLAQEPIVYDFSLTNVEGQVEVGQGFGQSVPGVGAMFVMFTVMGGMAVLLRERKNWTLQRLVMMPLSRMQIIGGKILMYFILGMIQFVILFGLGALIGQNFGSNVIALVLVMAAYALAVTALALALGTFVRTEGQAASLTTLLSVALASLGGGWWPLEVVPEFMRVIGHISPVAWAMDAFNTLIFFGGGLVDVLPSMAVLLVMAVVLFFVGARRFRYE
jgi:ABC-2 type transport system permease protein